MISSATRAATIGLFTILKVFTGIQKARDRPRHLFTWMATPRVSVRMMLLLLLRMQAETFGCCTQMEYWRRLIRAVARLCSATSLCPRGSEVRSASIIWYLTATVTSGVTFQMTMQGSSSLRLQLGPGGI